MRDSRGKTPRKAGPSSTGNQPAEQANGREPEPGTVVSHEQGAWPPGQRRGLRVTGLQAGVVMALAAVAAGAFFEVRPPEAYGICIACHGRDLVNWVANEMTGSRLTVAPASLVYPLLTVVGIVVGGWIAAVASGEFRWRPPRRPLKNFVHGLVVMNAGLLAAGCSTRLLLRASAGDIAGAAGFGAMGAGVVLATLWMRRRALR